MGRNLAPLATTFRGAILKLRHRVALGLILAEVLFIVWYFKYLPMVDLPQHILTANVLTHFTDSATGYDEFFLKRFPWSPYSSYFWFVMAVEPVVGVLHATRLYLSLAFILTVIAFGVWQREAVPGREPQTVVATLLLLGLFFYIGLVNYLFSVPFMFLSLALSLRLGRAKKSTYATELGLAVALLVTYFSHIVTFGVTLIVLGVQQLVIFRGRALVRLIRASVPSVALMFLWMALGMSKDISGMSWSWEPLPRRLEYFLLPFNVFADMDRKWIFLPQTVLPWLVVLAVVVVSGREKIRAKPGPAALVGLVLAACTLVVPTTIAASSGALRLSYPTAFALLALIPTGWDERKVSRWIVLAICVLTPLWIMPKIAVFQTEMAGLEEVIQALPERQVIQPVITEVHSTQFHTYPFLHAGAWYNFYKGGTNPDLFANVAHFPIRERRRFVMHGPKGLQTFRYEENHEGVDYFLVKTKRADIIADLSSHVPLAAQSGEWMAFGPTLKQR